MLEIGIDWVERSAVAPLVKYILVGANFVILLKNRTFPYPVILFYLHHNYLQFFSYLSANPVLPASADSVVHHCFNRILVDFTAILFNPLTASNETLTLSASQCVPVRFHDLSRLFHLRKH